MTLVARVLAPQPIDGAVPRRGDDPAAGARRHTIGGPPLERDGERVLDTVRRTGLTPFKEAVYADVH